jgi:hypothetical protein
MHLDLIAFFSFTLIHLIIKGCFNHYLLFIQSNQHIDCLFNHVINLNFQGAYKLLFNN